MTTTPIQLPPTTTTLRLAYAADVDQRTVRRALRGLPMRPSTRRRVYLALRRLGVTLPDPPTATSQAAARE